MTRAVTRQHRVPRLRTVLLLLSFTLVSCGVTTGSADSTTPSDTTITTTQPSSTTTAPTRFECSGPATANAIPAFTPIATDPEPDLPVTVTDLSGREVTITDVSRILALDTYGTLAATVHALGLGDNLVGRDISTGIPELDHLPVVTHNGHQLNAEAILNLSPTVILTDYSIGPLEVQLQLMDSGIPVVILSDQRGRAQIQPQISAVAEVLGLVEEGELLADLIESEVDRVETEIGRVAPSEVSERPRTIFLYVRGNVGVYYWFGSGSGADDLITSLHGVDVATEVGLSGMRPVNAEGLVRADPDLFLMMSLGLESVGGAAGLADIPGVADTRAGMAGCVVDMDDHQVLSFGPHYPSTLESLATAIYGGSRP